MSTACSFDGCTVAETGRCALEKDLSTCPNYTKSTSFSEPAEALNADYSEDLSGRDFGAPVLSTSVETPSLPASTTLGLEDVGKIMSSRYVTIVGILGDPESGKTAVLASLYLLIANAQLEGWSFADSLSLMAFEEIVQGARHWNEGNPPEQMTVRTELADERRPGFLHLRLRSEVDGRCVDLALPDIPGEWTKSFIRTSRSDRLQFLKSADVIWLVVDGKTLVDKVQRQGTITRLGQLAKRIHALVDGVVPRLILALTHHDEVMVSDDIIERINSEMMKHEICVSVTPIASFSDNKDFKPGFGLSDLINATVGWGAPHHNIWPATQPDQDKRCFLNYRRDQ